MKKNIIIGFILIVSIGLGTYIYTNHVLELRSKKLIIDNQKIKYDFSSEVKESLNSFDKTKKAEIISNVYTNSRILALSFEGISDKDTMNKIINSLNKYQIDGTFFVSGIKASENTDILNTIEKNGYDVENGTFNGKKKMEDLTTDELIEDFSKSNIIISNITGKKPLFIKCNSTQYNDNILEAAYASGNKYVAYTDHYLNYQSFKDYKKVYEYINNLKNGTIISIKLDGVLDESEYGKKLEEIPSIDKKTGINEEIYEKKDYVSIDKIVEWILKAMNAQNKKVINLEELEKFREEPIMQNLKNNNFYQLREMKNSTIKNNSNNINSSIIDKNLNSNNNESKTVNQEIKNQEDLVNFKELIEKNNKKQAEVISQFYTTQNALSYTFRGLSNEESLDSVLDVLDQINGKGTFFVTKDELLKYPDRINKILSRGHEIANGGVTSNSNILNKSTEDICKEIYDVDKLLKEKGIKTNAYMPGYGFVNSTIKEALKVITTIPELKDYELIKYSKAPIIDKYTEMSANNVVKNYFNVESYRSLQKGEIVYFRLDLDKLKNDNKVSNIIKILTKNYVQNGYVNKYDEKSKLYELTQRKLGYSIVSINNLQNTIENQAQFGRYKFSNSIIPLKTISTENALEMMKTNYIGNNFVNLDDFKVNEQPLLDKNGNINTNGQSVIFLTFDDWGGDPQINSLLEVLNKHNVKATFFVIGRNIDVDSDLSNSNPNLLRTIALEGNDVGSHNYDHELLDTGKTILDNSLSRSYYSMEKVIGDLHSLKPYFRPPTLNLTREGLISVFESGYKYSISGNITTHDYEKGSAQEILDIVRNGLVKNQGNIIVMHMNDNAYYTAEAVDIFLTNNENGVYGTKYKIAKLSDYLEK